MKAARIVLATPLAIEQAWCWRDEWVTGYDSAYGLLSKFARLNAMGAREVAEVFVARGCGRRTAIIRSPKVDLRTSEVFDREAMTRHMRLPPHSLTHAFLLERLVNSRRRSIDVLRWCPKCAHSGFHSALFQLSLVTTCQDHCHPLRTRCPKCRREMPYQLEPRTFETPFCCAHCGADFAPRLREVKLRSLRMRRQELVWIDNVVQLFLFEDKMAPVRLELNRTRKALGFGEIAMAAADWRRVQSDYTGFVTQLLDELHSEQSARQACLRYAKTEMVSRRTPLEFVLPDLPRSRRTKSEQIPIDQLCSKDLKRNWNERLSSSYNVYNATRRHLWRHVLAGHRRCISTAVQHLWWHMEGEKTSAFCPVAMAFLRWRMYWEACGVPKYLMAPMRKDPFGIVSWYATCAPICPVGWSPQAERWVANHILARSCLGSFKEYLELAMADFKNDRVEWLGKVLTGRFESYWAVTGRDSPRQPVRIYMQSGAAFDCSAALAIFTEGRRHRAAHLMQLARIRR